MHTKHKLARFAPLLLFAALTVLLTACPGVSGGGNNSSAPQITSFTASQTNVAAGTPVTLNWVITGVPTSLSLKGSDGTNLSSISGVSTTVTPTATTTYTLTATNSSGSDDAMTTVTVGGPVTPPTDGSRTVSFGVSLSQTGPFTSDADGSITAGDPRIVNVPASGGTFYAQVTYSGPAPVTGVTIYLANRSPANFMADLVQDTDVNGFTLNAETTGCALDGTQTSITCVYPIKVAAGTPNITALPGVSGEFAYVLRTRIADTAGGDPYNQPPRGYVTVGGSTTPPPTNPPPTNPPPTNPPPTNPPPTNPPVTPPGPTAPKINSFKADPSTITSGQSSKLSWSTSGTVTSLSISNGVGTVTGTTSKSVSPTKTTTYTLTAKNGSASTTKTATVKVGGVTETPAFTVSIEAVEPVTLNAQGLAMVSLQASTENEPTTGTTTYRWTATGANPGNVVFSDSISEDTNATFEEAGNYTLRLTATNGKSVFDDVNVEVRSVDATAPSVTIKQANGQVDPATTSPIRFTATFSEEILGFARDDVTIEGSTTANASLQGGPTTYTISIAGMKKGETIKVFIGEARATDKAGNPNTASTTKDNSVTYDGE